MKETLVLIAAAFGHAPVSEPALMVLFGAGLLSLATWVRRNGDAPTAH
jgi:hypothetical protein